jgi:hypothetical protein
MVHEWKRDLPGAWHDLFVDPRLGGVVRYRSPLAAPAVVLAPIGLVGFVVMAVAAAIDGRVVFPVVVLVAAGVIGYWLGWRAAYELQVDEERIVWRAPFGSGEVLRGDVFGKRWSWSMGAGFVVLTCRHGRDLLVWRGPGLTEFLEQHVLVAEVS